MRDPLPTGKVKRVIDKRYHLSEVVEGIRVNRLTCSIGKVRNRVPASECEGR